MKNYLPLVLGLAIGDARAEEPKYAVLVVDAEYDDAKSWAYSNEPDWIYNPETNRWKHNPGADHDNLYGFWNLEQEVEYMQKVLGVANAQNIPVYEVNMQSRQDLSLGEGMCEYVYYEDETGWRRSPDGSGISYIPPDPDHPDLWLPGHPEPCTAGKALHQLWDDNWIKITKNYSDSFQETPLDDYLQARGITDLIVMGQSEWDCVKTTITTAVKKGYRVHTSWDVIQSRGLEDDKPFAAGEDSKIYDPKKLKKFYEKNTHLADSYRELPIMHGIVPKNATEQFFFPFIFP